MKTNTLIFVYIVRTYLNVTKLMVTYTLLYKKLMETFVASKVMYTLFYYEETYFIVNTEAYSKETVSNSFFYRNFLLQRNGWKL